MAYTKTTWVSGAAPGISAANLNNLETQYDEAVSYVDPLLALKQAKALSVSLADGTYEGFTVAGTAGTALAFGDLVYFQTSDSRWELADADAEATAKNLLGICVQAAAGDGSATTILLFGMVRADATFPSMTIGAPVFMSTTDGDITNTAPSGAADIIRIIGYGVTADQLLFNPSPDFFEHS